MNLSVYDVIRSAYRSRLLFRTEAEYREMVGVSFETIRDRSADESALSGYYDVLDRECRRQCGESLYDMIEAYIRASAAVAGEGFDWMERRQLASRKKFCRWLFRRVSAPGRKMSVDEESKFSPRGCDQALFGEFYPEGYESGRVYDLVFVMLITFGVIRPFDLKSGRGRDITPAEVDRSLDALEALVTTLRDDTPQMGVLPKPIVFDVTLSLLGKDRHLAEEDYSVARIWEVVSRIEDACIAVSSPQKTAETEVAPSGYTMPGIWVDDADEGRSRFWIFPENKLMAFCYTLSDGGWVLSPYEFVFYRHGGRSGFENYCIFVTTRGNRQIINNGGMMEPTEIVSAGYACGEKDEYGLFGEIEFEIESGEAPRWFDWRAFRRLPSAHPLHERFMQVISDVYDPASPHSCLFSNAGAFLTDELDALTAIDNDYIYVSDLPAPDRYVMRCDRDDSERFWYEPVFRTVKAAGSLRDIEISPRHPLYILPRRCSHPVSERHRRFAEACQNINIDSQITIYHTAAHPAGVLCFNNFSIVFPLDDDCAELKRYGVVCITDRSELFV
ncbi:MAG: hypothetical protein HDS56_02025 [Barnesiella sp.]|nr:hypothetical protein [Barnesiella sp.]MBD5344071.1 hypothetical protein [Bacteroides sp.]